MGTRGLTAALERGAPLAEIVVRFRPGTDFVAATQAFNALGDDIDLYERPWYDDPALRVGSATKEALQRLFSWRLSRVPLERYDEATGSWSTWPGIYRWEELNEPHLPPTLVEVVESIGLTQPGTDDHGQYYE
jgi:hypothetical protein